MLFEIAKNSHFLQNLVVKFVSSVHPSIEHNLVKVGMIKKAMFHCELEEIEGSYFEFGVYEGTSLYGALKTYQKLKSKQERNFYGFDSFDEGFKYFDDADHHPYFKEGDFKSSYEKTLKRFKKSKNVKLIKGYFEEVVSGKQPSEICGADRCAIVFIDCDLMGPALVALSFVRPILERGSVIILDDYWAYKANSDLGTRGALNKFLQDNPEVELTEYYKYGHGGISFIVTNL